MTRSDGSQEGRDPMPASTRRQETPRPASTRKIAGRTTQARPGSDYDPDTGEVSGGRRWFGAKRRPDADPADGTRSGRGRGPSKGLAAAGIVVGLLAGGAGAYLATGPGLDPDNKAFIDQATTDEVAGLAATHAQRLVAIDHTELDAYHESLDEFLAPPLVEELDQTWDALSETYEQTQTVVEAQTQNAGVSFLAEDRAEVLLILNVSMERDGVAAGSTSGTYLVELTRMDGTWKLSSIPDLPS